MKIVCESCQAKYSISDDKVRGKVFKIRCKKCSHVIVVKGSGDGAAAGAAPSASGEFASLGSSGAGPSPFADAVWHIVVEGEQVGPLPESDVKARLARNEISPESFIWKEGFADWVKISAVPEFTGASAPAYDPGTPAFAPAPAPAFAAAADPFGAYAAGGGAGGDAFAAPAMSAAPMADLFASPQSVSTAGQAHPGLGASNPFAAFDSGGLGIGGGASAGNGAGHAAASGSAAGMTAQRSENSVLFSLGNLEALAKPVVAGAAAAAPRVQAPVNSEASGLIDIRAMAAMSVGTAGQDAGPLLGGGGDRVDLPSFAAPSLSPVAPVLLPLAQSGGTPGWMKGLVIGIAVVLLGMGAVIVKFVTAPPPQIAPLASPAAEPAAIAAAPGAPVPAAPVAAEPAKAAPPATPPPAVDEKLPPREETVAAAAKETKPDKSGRSGSRTSGSSGKKGAGGGKPEAASAPAEKPVAAAAPAKPSEPSRPKATDSIDDLLAAAGGSKKSAPRDEAPARKPAAEAPAAEAKALDKTDIVRGMTPVNVKARECFAQFKVPGMVNLKLTVAPSGKVSSVSAGGKFAGTPSGDCVESAAKSAGKFPPSAGMTFDYPVMLR